MRRSRAGRYPRSPRRAPLLRVLRTPMSPTCPMAGPHSGGVRPFQGKAGAPPPSVLPSMFAFRPEEGEVRHIDWSDSDAFAARRDANRPEQRQPFAKTRGGGVRGAPGDGPDLPGPPVTKIGEIG